MKFHSVMDWFYGMMNIYNFMSDQTKRKGDAMLVYRSVLLLLILLILCGTTECGQMYHASQPLSPAPAPTPVVQQLPPPPPQISKDMIETAMQDHVESGRVPDYAMADRWEELQQFYRQRKYEPAWMGPDGPQPQTSVLVESFCKASVEGFHPADYRPEKILSSIETAYAKAYPNHEELAGLDLLLTYTFLDYGYHLSNGRLDPTVVAPSWHILPSKPNLTDTLQKAIQNGQVTEALEELRPSSRGYDQLKDTLAGYQSIAQEGGWPRVEGGKVLRQGSKNPRVITLRKRLAESGDLDPGLATDDPVYDKAVTEAVASFQERHGLKVDGSLNSATVKAMNVPVEDRILQIKLNMERWRWLPRDLGERYILVNIPDFQLHAYDNDTEVLTMAVVVGQEFNNRATPTFSGLMDSVVFSPYWYVPVGIAKKEILPKLRQDPDYLAKHNYEMVSGGVVRQRPGPGNALGRIKFLFPNEFSIYLHDTPKKHLFKRHSRAYSHGCIRVQKPVELAMYVFANDPNWTEKRIRRMMHSGRSQGVKLTMEVPVYILYFTAFAKDGKTHFREDLYGQDKKLIEALSKEPDSDASDANRLCHALHERVKGKMISHNPGNPTVASGM